MRRISLLSLLFLIHSTFSPAQTTPPPPGAERPLRLPQVSEKKLPNGLLILVAPESQALRRPL
jgi:hypothetical protein